MNERVPDSSGLPLRAMVMVLLFLGVIFLLVGFQAIGSGGSSEDESTSSTVSTVTTTQSSTPAPAKADLRVYNISNDEGVASRTADRLKEAGWTVTETGNLVLPEVTTTTVFFGTTAGERESADEVGKLLQAPVQPRVPEVAEQPPGVIVAVTG
jgi:LytR cell envelope-related transcriptional attenuator